MKFKTTLKESDLKLDGIDVQVELRDSSIGSITFTDKSGKVIKVIGEYGFKACVKAPPMMVKKWRLSGKFAGMVDVCEDFDNDYDAKDRLREFERKYSGPDESTGLAITQVEVAETE